MTWITGVETIKRQTMAVWLQAKIRERGRGLRPTCCTPALSHSVAAAAVCSLWLYVLFHFVCLWLEFNA